MADRRIGVDSEDGPRCCSGADGINWGKGVSGNDEVDGDGRENYERGL